MSGPKKTRGAASCPVVASAKVHWVVDPRAVSSRQTSNCANSRPPNGVWSRFVSRYETRSSVLKLSPQSEFNWNTPEFTSSPSSYPFDWKPKVGLASVIELP